MLENRPSVLCIAGLDPSGAAGLLADIKTLEANHVLGLGVCSAITYQNATEFDGVDWVTLDAIIRQIEVLERSFEFQYVKIGIIESWSVLIEVVDYLISRKRKIIWDPILSASAGFQFHSGFDANELNQLLKKVYLVTPNLVEINCMFPDIEEEQAAINASCLCNVLLKGGHKSDTGVKRDLLMEGGKLTARFEGLTGPDKRGTGCILSSAITANLAIGNDLQSACSIAKEYMNKYIFSSRELIGVHYG